MPRLKWSMTVDVTKEARRVRTQKATPSEMLTSLEKEDELASSHDCPPRSFLRGGDWTRPRWITRVRSEEVAMLSGLVHRLQRRTRTLQMIASAGFEASMRRYAFLGRLISRCAERL